MSYFALTAGSIPALPQQLHSFLTPFLSGYQGNYSPTQAQTFTYTLLPKFSTAI
jgi:hypothetical protein